VIDCIWFSASGGSGLGLLHLKMIPAGRNDGFGCPVIVDNFQATTINYFTDAKKLPIELSFKALNDIFCFFPLCSA
jgi:hypothetical protein